MKMVGSFVSMLLFTCALLGATSAQAKPGGTTGEDPFPLQCVDFSGNWKADNGTRYKITQQDCKQLTINMVWNNYAEDTISIVPDNRTRGIPGMDRSAVRHRWNSSREGRVIETHRTWIDGVNKITEVVMYERVSTGLLLETTYSTVECIERPGQIQRDYEQQVFRRMAAGGSNDTGISDKKRTKR